MTLSKGAGFLKNWNDTIFFTIRYCNPFFKGSRKRKKAYQAGITMVEVLIAVIVFAMLALGIYYSMSFVLRMEASARERVLASNIAKEEMEIVRNMAYDSVGVIDGSPAGSLQQNKTVVSDGVTFNVSFDVRYVDDPYDGTVGGTPSDTNPMDYKLVQATVSCAQCFSLEPIKMTTTVAPKGIEGGGDYGFLFVKVINAAAQPVAQANVHIISTNLTPQRVIDSVTDNNGNLKILDLEPSAQGYNITVTKAGYSTDYTVTPSADNPNPIRPDATITLGTVTQVTFAIDLVSSLNISAVVGNCLPIGPIDFSIQGAKLIGTSPDVYKYSQVFTTNGSGNYTLNNLEWDMYTVIVQPGQGYDVSGYIPLSPLKIDPGSVNNLKIILAVHTNNSLLVTVKDNSTLLPLTGIDLKLYEGLSGWEYFPHPVTGQGYFIQTDWSGPSGQMDFNTNPAGYFSTDGNLSLTSPSGEIRLRKFGPNYAASGELTSSTFDTGALSNFYKIVWDPLSQPPQTGPSSVKFQIAVSNTDTVGTIWNFAGPDGTDATYYDSASPYINSINNSHRYLRYKIFLSTIDSSRTPNVGSVAISFNSGCNPPGQAMFTGLSNGNFSIDANDTTGYYQPYTGTVNVTGETFLEILLNH